MKNVLLTLVLLIISSAICPSARAVSMGQIMGRVMEKESNQPVALAIIIFENDNDKVIVKANEYGYYYADHLPVGRYQVRTLYNGRIFFANKVRVYDSYSYVLNVTVSVNDKLPEAVEINCAEPMINGVGSNDIRLTGGADQQSTQSLADVLMMLPGVDVHNGKIFIKGSSDGIKFYIDGSPVMASSPNLRGW